ncbi:MAG: heme-copper oxidase subunit III [Bryobacteraceae bacterium]
MLGIRRARSVFTPTLTQIGTAIALVSVSVFFLALIVVYAIIFASRYEPLTLRFPASLWASTALLLAASVSLETARHAIWRGRVSRFRSRLLLTVLLGGAFVVSQVFSWGELLEQGVFLRGNPHGSAFYLFTGAHGLHILGGLGWLGHLLRSGRALTETAEEHRLRRYRATVGSAALYWHFMTCIWAVLFVLLYRWSSI